MSKEVDLGIWHRLSQLVIVLIVAACLLGVFFWYLPVFEQNAALRQDMLALENQIKAEEQRKQKLQTDIRNLQDDPKTVERLARERLGYAKPGETVIFFESPRLLAPQ
ncbi:MAG TPA: septum formation initiator family protein [Verrucomicrobiae bacterium]